MIEIFDFWLFFFCIGVIVTFGLDVIIKKGGYISIQYFDLVDIYKIV